jgi:hypothetical protein
LSPQIAIGPFLGDPTEVKMVSVANGRFAAKTPEAGDRAD